MPTFLNKRILAGLLIIFLLIFTLFAVNIAFYKHLATFGCGDQCINFVAGFFMLKGKHLYTEIFFNHQPLMAYFSFWLQKLFQPQTLYQLVLIHRLAIMAVFLLLDFLFIWRFRWRGAGFVLLFETIKFYFSGNFFIPETIVAYLLAYLLGIWWLKTENSKIRIIDNFASGLFFTLVVFLREPYLPAATILYLLFLTNAFKAKQRPLLVITLLAFLVPSVLIGLNLPVKEYLEQVFIVNRQIGTQEIQINGGYFGYFLKVFAYPVLIFFSGPKTYLHQILIGLALLFWPLFFYQITLGRLKSILAVILILGLGGLRFIDPGTMYYAAFHSLPWFSLFLMSIFLFLGKKYSRDRVYILGLGLIFIYSLWPGKSFLWEKVNLQEEFNINYAPYFSHGNVIKTLSHPKDTLFLDLWDDLIYWQAGLNSSFRYSLYTPTASSLRKFQEARLEMFAKSPPDFYYSYYGASKDCRSLVPPENQSDYLQLYFSQNPTCLYLKKTKLSQITAKQWQEVEKLGYYLPKKELPVK